MAEKFQPKNTMQKNLNMLTSRNFAILGVCKIDCKISVQNGMSKNSLELVPPSGRSQLCRLSPVDASTVALKPVIGKQLDIIHDIVLWHFAPCTSVNRLTCVLVMT